MQLEPERIRKLRMARGWTQQQLADVTGLSLRTIQRVEREGNASIETINALCATLEVERQALTEPAPKPPSVLYTWVGMFLAGLGSGIGLTMLLT